VGGFPPVSVVVPVRNEVASLPALLNGLQEQTHPVDQVVIVDAGSSDGTRELAQRLVGHDARYRVLEVGPASPGTARNAGIRAARNDWIALTDAGIRPESSWLEALADVARTDPDVKVVFGNFEPVGGSFFQRCAALAYVSPKRATPAGAARDPFIASSLLHRDVWKAAGGFPDLRAAEDLIFMERVSALGVAVRRAPSATVWWTLAPTLRSTFRRFELYSKHNVFAGRQRHWHYGVARKYLVSLPFLVLGVWRTYWWLVVPTAGAMGRVAKSILSRREGRGIAWAANPAQFVMVGVIIIVIDAATFAGWIEAIWHRTHAASGRRPGEEPRALAGPGPGR